MFSLLLIFHCNFTYICLKTIVIIYFIQFAEQIHHIIIDRNWHILLIHTKYHTKQERKKVTKNKKNLLVRVIVQSHLDTILFQSRHDTASTIYLIGLLDWLMKKISKQSGMDL